MKKILFLLLFSASIASAQNSAITNAILYHKEGLLDKAGQAIELAVAHEKTKAQPKAWYYKGVIYMDIYRSNKPEDKALSVNPLKDSYEAFNKAMTLDASKGEYYKLSEVKLLELWGDVINQGITSYENEQAADALVSFETAQKIRPEDTTAYIYASYASEVLNDNEKLRQNTEALVKLNYNSPYVYRNRVYLEPDAVKKLTLAEKGAATFPKDELMIEILGDTYAEQGKHEEALNQYKTLNNMLPDNVTVLTKMALQYERLKQQDQALAFYQKIISMDVNNFLANYNAAIIHYEKGKQLDQEVHKLNVDEYNKRGKEMDERIREQMNMALNYANVALTQTKDDVDINNIKLVISEINKVVKK